MMQIMTPEQLISLWDKRLKNSQIIISSPGGCDDEDNVLFSEITIKNKYGEIKTGVQINYTSDKKVCSWFADFPVGNIEYRISGFHNIYDKEVYNNINNLIKSECQKVVDKFFDGSYI